MENSIKETLENTTNIPNVFSGTYQHYKGPLYQVLGVGHDSNIPDRIVVIYVAPPGKPGPALAVRDLYPDQKYGDGKGFFDKVNPETGETLNINTNLSETCVRRFTYLGPGRPETN